MDKVDMKILACLKENARLTASAIGDRINLSVSAVIERIKKLESNGIITGYTISVNQKKLGNDVAALMEVSLKHPDYYEGFVKIVKENPNITACYFQTGEFDFVLRITTHSAEGLEDIYRDIKSYEGVSRTETHFVLKSVKEELCALPVQE